MYFTVILELKFFSMCASPDENITALVHIHEFWVHLDSEFHWCFILVAILSNYIVDVTLWFNFLPKNCIDVTLLVKILPEKKLYCDCGITHNPYRHALPLSVCTLLLWSQLFQVGLDAVKCKAFLLKMFIKTSSSYQYMWCSLWFMRPKAHRIHVSSKWQVVATSVTEYLI